MIKGAFALRGLLRDGDFVRVWSIGLCSGIGRWLEMLVVGIFAFETTQSPFLVALLVILRMAPLVLFGPLVGAYADRLPPAKFMRLTLLGASFMSCVITLLFYFDVAVYWHVALGTFLAGMVWTTDMPLRRQILGKVAGPRRLAEAMSFDSASNNGTRMVGPLVGGVIYQWFGASGAFALSALLFGFACFLAVGISAERGSREVASGKNRILADMKGAFAFALNDRDVLRILLVTVVFNLWGFPFVSMIPVIGGDELNLSASGIGLLAALEGGGAFLAALVIAAGSVRVPYRRLYTFGTLAYLILIILVSIMPGALSTAVLLFAVGLAGACFTTMQSTLIYASALPEMRGRLFGLLVLCIGSGLIGFSNIGLMGEWYGGSWAIRIVAAEGIIPLLLITLGWKQLWGRA